MRKVIVATTSVALLLLACSSSSEVAAPPTQSVDSVIPSSPVPSPTKEKPERVYLPSLTSTKAFNARQRLRARGFKVEIKTRFDQFALSYAAGIVIDQRPGPGDIRSGRTVTLFVQPACTPGYSPCLAPAYDYDCAGGDGDGPSWTGFHIVTGFDPYGLDGNDNDGRGCE